MMMMMIIFIISCCRHAQAQKLHNCRATTDSNSVDEAAMLGGYTKPRPEDPVEEAVPLPSASAQPVQGSLDFSPMLLRKSTLHELIYARLKNSTAS